MNPTNLSSAAYADSKPHYHILDGLRGVAALAVICYHIFEAYDCSHFNHGYLSVDFFFILSGFVIGYAYDDRWKRGRSDGGMTVWEFFKRRLIRLHPMVVMGALIGGAMFYTQGCEAWDVSRVPVGALAIGVLMSALMIPATQGIEVRGIGEMFPINGPTWSLFFEYIGNVLYALVLRRMPTRVLAVFTAAAAFALAALSIAGPQGDLSVGWAATPFDLGGGMLRLLFAFSAGLLMSRIFRPLKVRGAFWTGALVIMAVAVVPRLGGTEHLWQNGIFDAACAIVLFPAVVWVAASGRTTDAATTRICKFLGDISYPLYVVHYPFIYLYYAWVKNNGLSFGESFWGAAAVVCGSILLAWLCLKLYDEPLRRLLARKFLADRKG